MHNSASFHIIVSDRPPFPQSAMSEGPSAPFTSREAFFEAVEREVVQPIREEPATACSLVEREGIRLLVEALVARADQPPAPSDIAHALGQLKHLVMQAEANGIGEKAEIDWEDMSKAASYIFQFIRRNDDQKLESAITFFLELLDLCRVNLSPFYDNLETFAIADEAKYEESRERIRAVGHDLVNRGMEMTPNEELYHLLKAIPKAVA